jgi:hypothetical protein
MVSTARWSCIGRVNPEALVSDLFPQADALEAQRFQFARSILVEWAEPWVMSAMLPLPMLAWGILNFFTVFSSPRS